MKESILKSLCICYLHIGKNVFLPNLKSDTQSLCTLKTKRVFENNVFFSTLALAECGYGKFHILLTIICGWANASDAIEILCISFLLPSAECDLDLTYARKGHINSILFAGMLIGGFLWGSLGDIYGRRTTLIVAMLVNCVAGAGSSLSQNYPVFLALRFISGLGWVETGRLPGSHELITTNTGWEAAFLSSGHISRSSSPAPGEAGPSVCWPPSG